MSCCCSISCTNSIALEEIGVDDQILTVRNTVLFLCFIKPALLRDYRRGDYREIQHLQNEVGTPVVETSPSSVLTHRATGRQHWTYMAEEEVIDYSYRILVRSLLCKKYSIVN